MSSTRTFVIEASHFRHLLAMSTCGGSAHHSGENIHFTAVFFISMRIPWRVLSDAFKTRPAGCGSRLFRLHPTAKLSRVGGCELCTKKNKLSGVVDPDQYDHNGSSGTIS